MSKIDELCINTIRFLAVDSVEKAKSGHPGLPLGAAPMAYVLWDRFLKKNPKKTANSTQRIRRGDRMLIGGNRGPN